MPDCCVKGCKSRRTEKRKNKIQLKWESLHGVKISFHRIPKELQERQKWVDRMQLNNTNIPNGAFFCSLHFEECDLDRTSLSCTRVRSGAAPCRNLTVKNYEGVMNQEKMDKHSAGETKNINLIKSEEMCVKVDVEAPAHESLSDKCTNISTVTRIQNKSIGTSTKAIDAVSQQSCSTPHSSKIKTEKTAIVLPYKFENTPQNRFLTTSLMNVRKAYQKKIKLLQEKQRRAVKHVAKLKDALTAMKRRNLLERQQLNNILKDLDSFRTYTNIEHNYCVSGSASFSKTVRKLSRKI